MSVTNSDLTTPRAFLVFIIICGNKHKGQWTPGINTDLLVYFWSSSFKKK